MWGLNYLELMMRIYCRVLFFQVLVSFLSLLLEVANKGLLVFDVLKRAIFDLQQVDIQVCGCVSIVVFFWLHSCWSDFLLLLLYAARPIFAVTEFDAQLQILELLDNVCLQVLIFFFTHSLYFLVSSIACYAYDFYRSALMYTVASKPELCCWYCRQFLQLAIRLSCTYILLLRSVRLFSCCSKLIQRLGNLWKRKSSLWRMAQLFSAVFRY